MALPTLKTGPGTGQQQWWKELPAWLVSFFLLVYSFFFLGRALTLLTNLTPQDNGEANIGAAANRLFQGHFGPAALYNSPAGLSPTCGPLFYYLNVFLKLLFGPDSLLAGRVLSLLATAGVLLVLFGIARSQELSAGRKAGLGISLAATLTPLATAAYYQWSLLARPDTLALLFSLLAAGRVSQANAERERWRRVTSRPYVVAGLLAALGILCRPGAIAAPLAIIIWLGLDRRWRDLSLFVATLTGTFVVLGLGFEVFSGGHFLVAFFGFSGRTLDLGHLWPGLSYLLIIHLALVALALIWLAWPFIGRFERVDLWRVYLIAAFLLGLLASLFGVGSNAWLETLALISLLAWWQVGHWLALRSTWRLGSFRPEIAPLILTALTVQLLLLWH